MEKRDTFLKASPLVRYSLRRYSRFVGHCPGKLGYHQAETHWCHLEGEAPAADPSDPRWPRKCDRCEYAFTVEDDFQVTPRPVWKTYPNGELVVLVPDDHHEMTVEPA
jgi:hypothetical protein